MLIGSDVFSGEFAIPALSLAPDGTVSSANSAMAHAIGRPQDGLAGQSIAQLSTDPAALDVFLALGAGAQGEFCFQTSGQDQRWLLLSLAHRTPAGETLLTACDVTERRERERQLQLTCDRYLDMATAGSDTLHEIDGLDGFKGVVRIVRARRQDGKLSFQESERLWPDEIVDPSYDPEGLAQYLELVTERKPYKDIVHRLKTADDREIYLRASAVPYFDDEGEFIGYRGISANVTKEILAERALVKTQKDLAQARDLAERASQAKSDFLANMSHEIRTPLNGVLGMAQAMAADALPPAQRERLTVIQHSGEALLTILNDILDLAKIEAGKLDLETVEFDLVQVVQGACSPFSAVAESKSLTIEMSIDDADGVYEGDPTRLRQIIGNLVSNALKFTDKGAVTLKAERVDGWLTLEVADNGIGMSPETLANLFGKFTQADASTTRRFGGTGLGLSICRQLAEMMGGTITARSTMGAGSTFILSLPLRRVGKARRPSAHPTQVAATTEPLCLRILAAEDNAINQLVLKTLLGQIGITPEFVETGAQALDAWEREAFDLILMDVQMPVMDGVTATRLIRAREVELGRARTPIYALSANAMSHQITEYAEAGMDGHVAKPIAVDKLFAALQAVVDQRGQACEAGHDLAQSRRAGSSAG